MAPRPLSFSAGMTEAAVLAPVYRGEDGRVRLVFILRTPRGVHGGQIAFPGGRREAGDADLLETALREAEEEIGLARDEVDLVGALPPVGTFVTGYRIHPFVGVIRAGHAWTLQPDEVDEVLELSLRALVEGYANKRLLRRGVPIKTPTYTVGDNFVWGATARIVEELLERLRAVL